MLDPQMMMCGVSLRKWADGEEGIWGYIPTPSLAPTLIQVRTIKEQH